MAENISAITSLSDSLVTFSKVFFPIIMAMSEFFIHSLALHVMSHLQQTLK